MLDYYFWIDIIIFMLHVTFYEPWFIKPKLQFSNKYIFLFKNYLFKVSTRTNLLLKKIFTPKLLQPEIHMLKLAKKNSGPSEKCSVEI